MSRRSSVKSRKHDDDLSSGRSSTSEEDNNKTDTGDRGFPVLRALYDYEGTTQEELSFMAGETLILLNSEHEEWWYVRKSAEPDIEGYVPATYVRFRGQKKSGEVSSDEETESQYADNLDQEQDSTDNVDSDSEQKSLRRKNSARQKYSSSPVRMKFPPLPLAKKLLAPENIEGFPSLPQGIVLSTLAKNYNSGIGHTSLQLTPQLDATGLAFRDLQLDNARNQIKAFPVKCNIAFSILEAKNILNIVAPDIEVHGRQLRMALFDKTNVLSNIHTISAVYNPDLSLSWRFSNKSSFLFPKDDENTCFVRVNHVDIKLALLFELCLTVSKPGEKELFELSCGWGMLPIFTSDGGPLETKTYDIKLYGGTPFVEDIPLNEPPKKGFLEFFTNKTPRLHIRLWSISDQALRIQNMLPETLIGNLKTVPLFAMYRNILARSIAAPKKDGGVGRREEPVLSIFRQVCESPDLLQFLVVLWERNNKKISRYDRRSYTKLCEQFKNCVLLVWPLLHITNIPSECNTQQHLLERAKAIATFQTNGIVDALVSNATGYDFAPFDSKEVTFEYLKIASKIA